MHTHSQTEQRSATSGQDIPVAGDSPVVADDGERRIADQLVRREPVRCHCTARPEAGTGAGGGSGGA